MDIFIKFPFLAAAVGLLLLGVGWCMRRRITVGAGVMWLLYALYELGMKRRWLCSGECNIRIDLLVIYPILLLGLAAAAVGLLRDRAGRPPAV